jgi:hypothetical protein
VSLFMPIDSTPKPPERGTHLTLPDDTTVLPDLPHLQPEEMREMEMVLRSYWQTAATEPDGDERFKGPPPEELQAGRWGSRQRSWQGGYPGEKRGRAT